MITGVNYSKVGVYMGDKRKIVVRSVRLSEENDEKFLAIHEAYSKEYLDKMISLGLDSMIKTWTYADTTTRMVRDTFDIIKKDN